MTKTKTVERIDINTLRPKKLKPFDKDKFLKMATKLKKAVEEEEKKYGPIYRDPRFL